MGCSNPIFPPNGQVYFERQVKQGKGKIEFRLTDNVKDDVNHTLSAVSPTETLDIRAACMHLIFAALVTTLERPWEQEFAIDNKQLENYLGLDKRKDLTKATKLTLIKTLVQQPCKLIATIDWPQQGKIKSFSVPKDRIWHLVAIDNHFQEDDQGYKHLVAMTFRLKAGIWAQYFPTCAIKTEQVICPELHSGLNSKSDHQRMSESNGD